jgi:hypothetical protein
MNEVNSMWKLNVLTVWDPPFSIAYERRIKNNIYYEAKLAPTILWNTKELGWVYAGYASYDVRYYHGFRRLRKRGKPAHSLFGNFVSLGMNFYLSNLYMFYDNSPLKDDIRANIDYIPEHYYVDPTTLYGKKHTKGYMFMPTIKYGIQRRLFEIGYIELIFGYGIGKSFSSNVLYQNFIGELNLGLNLVGFYNELINKK